MIDKPLCIEIDDFVDVCIRVFVCANEIKWFTSFAKNALKLTKNIVNKRIIRKKLL